jgi:non-ribosomal peptide synthetase component F
VLGSMTHGELNRRSAELAAGVSGDAQVLALADPAALIVAEGVEGPPTPVLVVWIDAPSRAVSGTPAVRTATDLAYVMFTRSTSGAPKGVCVSHGALLGVSWGHADEGALKTSSLRSEVASRQVFTALLVGPSIHHWPPEMSWNPAGIVAFMRQDRVTIFNSVRSLLGHLMGALERNDHRDPLPDAGCVLLGGEAVSAVPVRRWWARWAGRVRLTNLYGRAESVVNSTGDEVVRDPGPDERHCSIGHPRSGVEVGVMDVVDGMGKPVVRALVYLGRVDAQEQVRGNRLELGAMEHALGNHPGVAQAVVVQDRCGAPVAAAELRAFLGERQPVYVGRHGMEVVTALPRNAAARRVAERCGTPRCL